MKKTPFINKSLKFGLPVLFFISFFSSRPALAAEARLTDIVVTNTRDYLLAYFSVADCFTENMKSAIDNGVSTTFTFFLKLYEVRDWWWDRNIADLKVLEKVPVHYNVFDGNVTDDQTHIEIWQA